MNRIVIAGLPRTGKTLMASEMANLWPADTLVRHTDDLIETHTWVTASQAVCHWFDAPGPWIIEGCTISRALRKWRNQHPGAPPPIERCIFLTDQYEALTVEQQRMATGILTIQSEIADWLREHDVRG